jgi:hypothetical protein
VRRPIARPIASTGVAGLPCTGGDSSRVSAANDSPLGHISRFSATRLESLSSRLAERDWEVLNFVSACRLASGKQLVRRFWNATREDDPSAARAGRRTLKRLADWRVLDPLPGRTVGGLHGGSGTLIYSVGVIGARLLARQGFHSRRLDAPGAHYTRHTLAITELVVRLYEADRDGHLELIAYETEPACWRGFIGVGGVVVRLKPDLFVRVGAGERGLMEDRWFIEVDLATESSSTIRSKAERHVAYWRCGSEPVHPRVLWVVSDERRAGQVIDALPRQAKQLFAVCLMDEAVAYLAEEARS